MLVGRELCLFLSVDAQRVPVRQRGDFVALAVRRAAPFPDPEHGIGWTGDTAAVWYWSRSRIEEAAGSIGGAIVQPEALFLGGRQHEDVCELLALPSTTGHEGRCWRGGRLVASKWWPALPSPAQWSAFLRGAGWSPATPLPQPRMLEPLSRPWSTGAARHLPAPGELQQLLWRTGLASAAVLVLWQLGTLVGAHIALSDVNEQADALREEAGDALDARERADVAREQIQALLALRPPMTQAALLEEVRSRIPGDEWQLKQWTMANESNLELTLSTARPDPERMVAALEASPALESVTAELSRRQDEIVLRARVLAPAVAGDAATAAAPAP